MQGHLQPQSQLRASWDTRDSLNKSRMEAGETKHLSYKHEDPTSVPGPRSKVSTVGFQFQLWGGRDK